MNLHLSRSPRHLDVNVILIAIPKWNPSLNNLHRYKIEKLFKSMIWEIPREFTIGGFANRAYKASQRSYSFSFFLSFFRLKKKPTNSLHLLDPDTQTGVPRLLLVSSYVTRLTWWTLIGSTVWTNVDLYPSFSFFFSQFGF